MNLIDRMIRYVSPERAFKREQYRNALRVFDDGRHRKRRSYGFEGADRGRRTEGWKTLDASADAQSRDTLALIRARSRALFDNFGPIRRAIRAKTNNLVGVGLHPQFPDGMRAAVRDTLRDLWREWFRSTAIDAAGDRNGPSLQRSAARSAYLNGESLMRVMVSSDRNLPLPVQLMDLESDFIDTHRPERDRGESRNRVINGVEVDQLGRRVAFWLFDQHPGDRHLFSSSSNVSHRHEANRFIFTREQYRAGQVRGVPCTVPCIIRARDLDSFYDAELLKQRIAASFAGFTHTAMGPAPGDDEATSTRPGVIDIEPGTVEDLEPGREITFAQPPQFQSLAEFSQTMLRDLAVGLEVPYEILAGDLSRVNYSAGKYGHVWFVQSGDADRVEWFVPQFCNGLWSAFRTGAILAGRVSEADIPATVTWSSPPPVMIDPPREIPAKIKAVRAMLCSLPQAIRDMGVSDPEEHVELVARFNELLDRAGLVTDTDPRKVTLSGQPFDLDVLEDDPETDAPRAEAAARPWWDSREAVRAATLHNRRNGKG